MTYSGCAAGHADPSKDNLKPEYYELFCDYLIDVCKHYQSAYQINFKTLEPFNEAYSNYWYAEGTQEGCHFDPETQIKIIRLLYPKLRASGLNTVIAASDETNLEQFLTVQKAYQKAGEGSSTRTPTPGQMQNEKRYGLSSGNPANLSGSPKPGPMEGKGWRATCGWLKNCLTTCASCAHRLG